MTDLEKEKNVYFSGSFNGLDLSKKEVCSKEFESCDFKKCNFNEAMLKKCKFVSCGFTECDLSVVKLGYSQFRDVVFDECKIIGVDWTRASWPGSALSVSLKFHKCIVDDSSFFGLRLEEMVMEGCRARDVDFREGNFSRADFTHTDFANSLFGKTDLTGADFTGAANYNIDFYANTIRKARFSRYEAVRLLESVDIELVD